MIPVSVKGHSRVVFPSRGLQDQAEIKIASSAISPPASSLHRKHRFVMIVAMATAFPELRFLVYDHENMRSVRRPFSTFPLMRKLGKDLIGNLGLRLTGKEFARDLLLPFFLSRLALVVIASLSFYLLPPIKYGEFELKPDGMIGPILRQPQAKDYPLVKMWARWDSRYYLTIAKDGYQFERGKQNNVAFFPLYPLLVRAVHYLIPFRTDAGWFAIGILISNAALVAALAYFYSLVSLDYERSVAARSVLYLLLFPTTLFLSAFYSEALFLALVLGTFYYARTARWVLSVIMATIAAGCRPQGVLLVAPLVFEYLQQKEFHWRRVRADLFLLLLIPSAVASYLLFLRVQFGNWSVLHTAESAWDRKLTAPWNTFITYFQQSHSFKGYDSPVNLFFLIAFVVLAAVGCTRLRPSYSIYAVSSVMFMTCWGFLMSVPRFGVTVFPMVIVLADWGRRPSFHWPYLATSVILAATAMVVFAQWGWIA